MNATRCTCDRHSRARPAPALADLQRSTRRIRAWKHRLDAMAFAEDDLDDALDRFGEDLDADPFFLLNPYDALTDAITTARGLYYTWQARMPRYGCYCGKGNCVTGNRPVPPVDGLDACCRAHDDAYTALHVGVPGGTNMWSPRGFIVTRGADLALVRCSLRQSSLLNPSDPVRTLIHTMFSGRAAVGALLSSRWVPAAIQNERTRPLPYLLGGLPRA